MTTDCKSLLNIASSGTHKATSSKAALARIWCRIASTLDGDTRRLTSASLLRWTPAHLSQASIGKPTSDGERIITAVDWRANRLADALAKEAAAVHAADAPTVRLLRSAEEAAKYHLALLGAVTHRANHCPVRLTVNGEEKWTYKSDSVDRPKAATAAQKRARSARPLLLEHRTVGVKPGPASCNAAAASSNDPPAPASRVQQRAADKRARATELAKASQSTTDRAVSELASRLRTSAAANSSAGERMAALKDRLRLRQLQRQPLQELPAAAGANE